MSEYVYHCENCSKEFTRSQHMSEHDQAGITCPHCGSDQVQQVVTAFSAVTSKKS